VKEADLLDGTRMNSPKRGEICYNMSNQAKRGREKKGGRDVSRDAWGRSEKVCGR
jgi:hypothetical protein